MTRVVVQRIQGTGSSSQNRSTTPVSAAPSLPTPSPPPLPPPPPPPLPPRPSAPLATPSSLPYRERDKASIDSKLGTHDKSGITKEQDKEELDYEEGFEDGRREFSLGTRRTDEPLLRENIGVTEIFDKIADKDNPQGKRSQNAVPPRPHGSIPSFQNLTQSSSDQEISSQTRNIAFIKDPSALSHDTSPRPPSPLNLACNEMSDGTDSASMVRQKSSCFSHASESAGTSYFAPSSAALPFSLSSQSLGSSRRGGWSGMTIGNRAPGSSVRSSWNIKTVKSSSNRSRSTSPRSHEGDGYNSSDELSWASGPTAYEDIEERERQFEIELRRTKGLEVRRIAEDGNCLFRAIADQVYGDPEMYDETRQLCIDYMETERDHFSQFVTESFTAYCKRKRRDKVQVLNICVHETILFLEGASFVLQKGNGGHRYLHLWMKSWCGISSIRKGPKTAPFLPNCVLQLSFQVYGNNLEIQAMAEIYNRPIHIHSYSADPINIFHGSYETDLPPIRLSYHRGNHYNSLHDPSRPSVGAGLGFGSFHGTAVDRDQVKAAIKAQQDRQIDKALLAEGRYYSDLELTEQEIENMVIEESRAGFLAEEKLRQHTQLKDTSTSSAAEPSSSAAGSSKKVMNPKLSQLCGTSTALADKVAGEMGVESSSNIRMLLSMGFSYVRIMEAVSIFGDDMNNILCYLLEMYSNSFEGESIYRMKGKAAER